MIDHMTDVELRDFAAGRLPAEDVLRADEHLSGCEECRARAVALTEAVKRVPVLDALLRVPEIHVSDEELQLLIERRLPVEARQTVERHVAECAICATQVEELRPWAAAAGRPSLGLMAIAAAAIFAVLIPTALRETRSHRSSTPPSLAGLEALAPADQAAVRAALAAGAATLPPSIAELAPGRETLMGRLAEPVDTFELIAPVATAIVTDTPTFEWKPLDRAEGYVVAVADERSDVVLRSPFVTATKWTSSAPLPRGATYMWQVSAHRAGDTITVPVAPARPAGFHIIGAREAELLRQAERDHPGAHLLLGILEMNAGVSSEAAKQFEQVAPDDPNVPVAQRSLARLRALAHGNAR